MSALRSLILAAILGSTMLRAAEKPHVIFILVDDMGWSDPSCYGGQVPTPAMDKLAAEGMRFARFYTASPICSASRCGIITGQFPARWKITSYLQAKAGNAQCEQANFLDPEAPSMPRAFKQAGYATAHIGKWHLGGGRDVTDAPKFAAYGYDLGLGTYESPEPAAALGLKTEPWSKEREPQQVARHDRSRWMVDQTIAFLKEHAAQPCFVNLWLDDVHTPYVPSDEQRLLAGEGPGTAEYRAVLKETDRQIGRLLAALKEMRIDDHTLVLVAGDNGPQPTFDRARSGGLRGMKWSLYEAGVRTPLIVRLPGVIAAGNADDSTVVGAVDLFVTLAHLCGVPTPDAVSFDGEDMSAAFKGTPQARTKPLLWEYGRKPAPAGKTGIRLFPYPTEPEAKSPNVAMRDGDWKLLINADGSEAQLYHLGTDPKETKNLIHRETGMAELMKTRALEWRRSLP